MGVAAHLKETLPKKVNASFKKHDSPGRKQFLCHMKSTPRRLIRVRPAIVTRIRAPSSNILMRKDV